MRSSPSYNPGTSVKVVRRLSTADVNSVVFTGQPATLLHVCVANFSASPKFVRLYNSPTAPAAGSTPLFSFVIPAGQSFEFDAAEPIPMTTGIGLRITNAAPDNDATAVAAGDVSITIVYAN